MRQASSFFPGRGRSVLLLPVGGSPCETARKQLPPCWRESCRRDSPGRAPHRHLVPARSQRSGPRHNGDMFPSRSDGSMRSAARQFSQAASARPGLRSDIRAAGIGHGGRPQGELLLPPKVPTYQTGQPRVPSAAERLVMGNDVRTHLKPARRLVSDSRPPSSLQGKFFDRTTTLRLPGLPQGSALAR